VLVNTTQCISLISLVVGEYELIFSFQSESSFVCVPICHWVTTYRHSCWDGKSLDSPDHKVGLTFELDAISAPKFKTAESYGVRRRSSRPNIRNNLAQWDLPCKPPSTRTDNLVRDLLEYYCVQSPMAC